jgi:hypothetical protein
MKKDVSKHIIKNETIKSIEWNELDRLNLFDPEENDF